MGSNRAALVILVAYTVYGILWLAEPTNFRGQPVILALVAVAFFTPLPFFIWCLLHQSKS